MKIKTTIYMMIAAMICGIFVGCSGHKAALSLAPEGGTWHDMTLPVKLSLKSPTSFRWADVQPLCVTAWYTCLFAYSGSKPQCST